MGPSPRTDGVGRQQAINTPPQDIKPQTVPVGVRLLLESTTTRVNTVNGKQSEI